MKATRSVLATLAVAGLCVYGCTNDYDALQVGSGPIVAPDSGAAGSAGSGGTAGSSGSAGSGGGAGQSAGGSAGSGDAGSGGSSAGSGGAAGASGGTGGSGGIAGSAGAGGTAGTAGQAGTGGTGGSGTVEDCLDGIDNNGDGLVDCADPQCTPGYKCVAAAPPQWESYFWLNDQGWQLQEPPSEPCPSGRDPRRYYAEPGQRNDCDCNCGELTGAECAPAKLGCSTNSDNCNNPQDWTATYADGACHKPPTNNRLSCRLTEPARVQAAGSCTESLTVDRDPTWGTVHDACRIEDSGRGCPPQQVCVPRGQGEYDGPVCIRREGDRTCPGGWSTQVKVYQGGTDDRDCTECTCSITPDDVTCSGTVYTVYDDNNCSDQERSEIGSGQCVNATPLIDYNSASIRLTQLPTATGACTALGGYPIGRVDTHGTTTFCCE